MDDLTQDELVLLWWALVKRAELVEYKSYAAWGKTICDRARELFTEYSSLAGKIFQRLDEEHRKKTVSLGNEHRY